MSFRSRSSDIGDKHQEALMFFEFLIDIKKKKRKILLSNAVEAYVKYVATFIEDNG